MRVLISVKSYRGGEPHPALQYTVFGQFVVNPPTTAAAEQAIHKCCCCCCMRGMHLGSSQMHLCRVQRLGFALEPGLEERLCYLLSVCVCSFFSAALRCFAELAGSRKASDQLHL